MLPTVLIPYAVAAVRHDGSFVSRLTKELNLFCIVSIGSYVSRLLCVAHRDGWPLNSDHLSWGLRLIFLALL